MTAPRRDLEARTLNLYVAGDDGDALVVNAGGVDVFTVDSDGALTVTGPVATGGTLTTYTPTADLDPGAGTITGKYQLIGDMMDLFIKVDLGAGFDLTYTNVRLPPGWRVANDTHLPAWYTDAGVPGPLIAFITAVVGNGFDLYTTAGAAVGATAPITWTADDNIYITGRFQVVADD